MISKDVYPTIAYFKADVFSTNITGVVVDNVCCNLKVLNPYSNYRMQLVQH